MLQTKQNHITKIALVIANIIPLIGVLFFGWKLFDVMFLYWLESAIIGFFNIFKIIKVSGFLSIMQVPFFIVHYGGFMAVHLVFIIALFSPIKDAGFFPSFSLLFSLIGAVILPFIALFISHGISFYINFVKKHEHKAYKGKDPMTAPYKRIILMHFTIIFGGWLILLLNTPVLALVLLIALKTFFDLKAHIKEHASLAQKNRQIV